MCSFDSTSRLTKCLLLIKTRLKQRNITYKQLADKLGISVTTVKRQLNANDIAFNKLILICDAGGISFTEVWQGVEAQKPAHTTFTKVQDEAFCRLPQLYQYFTELFYNKKSPKQVQIENKLTDASSYLYLRKLEDIGLLSLSTSGKVTFLVSAPLGFMKNTKFVFKEFQKGLLDVSNRLANADQYEDFIIVKPLILPAEIRTKMYKEVVDLVSRYAEFSERYYSDSDHPCNHLVICDYRKNDNSVAFPITNLDGVE